MDDYSFMNTHVVRKLRQTSPVDNFDCGDLDLNDFLQMSH